MLAMLARASEVRDAVKNEDMKMRPVVCVVRNGRGRCGSS